MLIIELYCFMYNDRESEEEKERKTKIRQLQYELFSLENSQKSLVSKGDVAAIEVKRLKTTIAKLEAELHDREATVVALDREIDQIDEEIAHQKKKMNAV